MAASAALDIVDIGGGQLGIVQDFLEQHDLLSIGGIGGSFQPESFVVRTHVHRSGVHSLSVFGTLQIHNDNGITSDTPLA